jgi:GT2 family glycosyltransferase
MELFDAIYLSKIFPTNRLFGRFAMSYWDFDAIREVDFAGGSCLLVRRNSIKDNDLLDERFFMYSEEADLCYRLKKDGWKVIFLPDAQVIHYGGRSSRLDVNRTSIQLCRSKYIFMQKHYGSISALAYRLIILLSSIIRVIAWAPGILISQNRHIYGEKISIQGRLFSWAVMAR